MARAKDGKAEQAKQQTVVKAKDWVRHTLMQYGMKMEDTAGLSQQDAEEMLESCREEKRRRMEEPATDAQKAELEKLGLSFEEGMTVKQASDAMRDHYRRQAPPVTEAQKKWLEAHHVKEDIMTKAEASRAIARHICKEEIPRYMPPKDGKFAPKDLYLIEARRQYEANERSFRNYDEIGIIQKMLAEGVTESTVRSTVSVYSPLHAKCTEKQLDYLVGLAASDKKVAAKREEKEKKVKPPSEKQIAIMKKKKIAYTEGMSGLQAAALIARKLNLETLQNHKPDLSKERHPVEFYRSFAQAELRRNNWDLKRYSDTPAVIAMADRGFTKSVICSTLNDNSPKCGKSLEEWLERTVGRVLEKHEQEKREQAEKIPEKEAKTKEEPVRESPMASLGTEVPFEDDAKEKTMETSPESKDGEQKEGGLKYELTNITVAQEGMLLRRIRALKDIPERGISAGDFGGYVLSGKNLSQEGTCWIAEEAKVSRSAIVCEDAVVCGKAEVTDRAIVAGEAWVDGESHVQGNAVVIDSAVVNEHGVVAENGLVCEDGFVKGFGCVKGNGLVAGSDNGIEGKTVVERSAEDLTEYLSSLQQTYRDAIQEETAGRRTVDTIAHISGPVENIKPVGIKRPVRRGLEKDNEPVRKRTARKSQGEKEKKAKSAARKQ